MPTPPPTRIARRPSPERRSGLPSGPSDPQLARPRRSSHSRRVPGPTSSSRNCDSPAARGARPRRRAARNGRSSSPPPQRSAAASIANWPGAGAGPSGSATVQHAVDAQLARRDRSEAASERRLGRGRGSRDPGAGARMRARLGSLAPPARVRRRSRGPAPVRDAVGLRRPCARAAARSARRSRAAPAGRSPPARRRCARGRSRAPPTCRRTASSGRGSPWVTAARRIS